MVINGLFWFGEGVGCFSDAGENYLFNEEKIFGYGALSGKMLLVRIVKNNKIDAYFRAG